MVNDDWLKGVNPFLCKLVLSVIFVYWYDSSPSENSCQFKGNAKHSPQRAMNDIS